MDNITKYKLSQYKNIKELNSDGSVILCYDLSNDRTCIKKFIDAKLCGLYHKLRDIKIEYLPEIYDILEYDNNCLVIEEYIAGRSLEEAVENGNFSEIKACKYFTDISGVLKIVHKAGIIHRDISPDNIIIDKNDTARLMDFGIARISNSQKNFDTTILGTAGFASPEQFGFSQTDERSDVYSMGVLLNYMLSGHIVQMGVYGREPLHSYILKATNISPDLRYSNIGEFERDILNCIPKSDKIKMNFKSSSNLKHNIEKNDLKIEKLNSLYSDSETPKSILKRIPGFRTGKLHNKIIAIILYIYFIPYCAVCIDDYGFTRYGLGSILMYFVVFLFPMWWFGDYGKNWRLMPISKNESKKNQKAYAIILYVIILFISVLILGA